MSHKELRYLFDGTCNMRVSSDMWGYEIGQLTYKVVEQRCRDCGKWYKEHEQSVNCPHVSYDWAAMNPYRPQLDIEDEIRFRKNGYIFARRVDEQGRHPMEFVNACPHGPAYPENGNLKAHAWYAGWWFYWYVVKRWKDVAKQAPSFRPGHPILLG